MAQYYIANADVQGWLGSFVAERDVFAPVREGDAVVFRKFADDRTVELALRPTESAKCVMFPRSEELFTYSRQRKNDEEGGRVLALKEPEEPRPSIVFGALPCDARGFFAFDPVYDGSGTQGKFKDTYYLKRRSQTIVIAKACNNRLATCFCHWVGGSPVSTEGVDVLATSVGEGFVLEVISELGKEAVKGLKEATADQTKAVQEAAEAVVKSLPEAPDLTVVKEGVLKQFENKEFWLSESAKCISCGTCTYLCPTCYCFNITDESNGIDGVRLRSWDNCMSSLFTLEASGHNPRVGKADRMRNRVGHKFSYYPELHGGRFSCVGCGRCIKSCPSMVDIRQIVVDAINVKEASNG